MHDNITFAELDVVGGRGLVLKIAGPLVLFSRRHVVNGTRMFDVVDYTESKSGSCVGVYGDKKTATRIHFPS